MRGMCALAALMIVGSLAVVYVTNTFLYLAPANPVKLRHARVIYGIEQPLFSQNWHLFAPNPIKTNFVLAIRCRTRRDVTPWRDPFTPLLVTHHRNRFTPMGKVVRIPLNAIFSFLGRTTDEWRPLICRRQPGRPACRGDDPPTKKQRDLGRFLLQRISSASCDQLVGPGHTTAVQVRILIHTPPPFSQRMLPSDRGTTKYLTLPWLSYQPWIATYGGTD